MTRMLGIDHPIVQAIVRYASMSPHVGTTGRIDELSLWSGQSVALVKDVLPAAEIVQRTVTEAEAILARLNARI